VDAARSAEARPRMLGAAALALAGPAAWLLWNRAAHGDALHFWARVTAYQQALGRAAMGTGGRLGAYPLAMVREEPEIAALFVAAAAITAIGGGVAALRARLAPYARPLAIVGVQITALSLAMIKDGAPTHHPERAMLAALLLIALMGGALAAHALAAGGHRTVEALALVSAVALAAGLGRSWTGAGSFAQRGDEEAIGRATAALARPGERVLIEVIDYGHLAITAALGRPEDAVPDRSVDPRDAVTASSFSDAATLRRRASTPGLRWAVARSAGVAQAVMGAPVAERGAWGVFRVGASP